MKKCFSPEQRLAVRMFVNANKRMTNEDIASLFRINTVTLWRMTHEMKQQQDATIYMRNKYAAESGCNDDASWHAAINEAVAFHKECLDDLFRRFAAPHAA